MKNIMQAYKLKGKIDQSGNLVITEPLNLPPRKGEIVVWAATDTLDHTTTHQKHQKDQLKSRFCKTGLRKPNLHLLILIQSKLNGNI